MNNLKWYFLSFVLCSCCVVAQSKTDSLSLHFHLKFGNTPLVLNKEYVTAHKDTLTIETFRCYISNIKIRYSNGTSFTQPNSYHLLDATDLNSLRIPVTAKDDKVITGISFNIGIDSITNTSGAMAGDLDPLKGMYWAWQSGYINMKVEGKSPSCKTRKKEFQFHIGGYLNPNYALRTVELAAHAKSGQLDVVIDLNAFFLNIHLSETNSIMIPGKQAMMLADYSKAMFYLQ